MTYRAEIEIGVKGTEKLRELRNTVDLLANKIDKLDSLADVFNSPIQSLKNYNQTLRTTAKALEQVELGQKDEAIAIRQYVQAVGQANTARARQNNLIQQEIALQEAAKRKTQPGPTGFSRAEFGPALPPAFIKQQNDQQNFKNLFADLNETAKVISVSNTNTRTSWKRTFDELNETAKAISVSRLNTQASWKTTFDQLNETAKAIAVNRLNTQTSWQETFKQLNETAKAISVSRLNTQTSWQETFKQLNETAKAISVSRLNTQTSWQNTLNELKETSKVISLSRLKTENSWKQALEELEETAKIIRQKSALLKEQERRTSVRENISRGRSAGIARRRSAFLLGKEQPGGPQGPLKGPAGTGFRVALPLSKEEQKGLDIAKQKLDVINRTERAVKELSGSNKKLAAITKRGITDEKRKNGLIRQRFGLRGALQDLETKSKVAIADANRAQDSLNDKKRRELNIEEQILNKQQRRLEVSKLLGKTSPIRGSETIPGSPRFLEARARRRRDAASNALIGGAFPLLFGQGIGSAAGGALGGGLGGLAGGQFGFGASLVGTALGQAVDQFVAQATEAGKALTSTGTTLDFVREKSLFSSEQTEQRAAQLEELGRVEEIANLLTSELVSLIGNNGVEALQELGRTTDKTTELWNELTLQLSALIAGPLNGFLSIVNQLLGRVTTGFRFNALLNDLEPEQRQKAESRLTELTQRVGTGRTAAKRQETEGITTTEAQKKVIEEFGKLVPQTAKIPVTVKDRERFTVTGGSRSRKGVDNASRAAAELARLEAQISSEKVRQIELDIRKSRITLGEVELIKKQTESNKERLELTVETINKQRSQALARNKFKENEDAINKLYDSRVKTAEEQVDISNKENDQRLKLLEIEREISKERRQRQFDQQLQGVDRDIERTRIQLQSPFGGEEQQSQLLSLDQRLRREDAAQASSNIIKDYNNQISKLNKNDDRNRAILEEKIRAEELFQEKLQSRLQVQDQLEQQQLRQNQLIEKFGFIADEVATAISSSVQAIITGTGSVQEAFTTLFENIGRAFVDLASQVLAQKAFLAVLNLFNPGSSLFSSGSSGFNLNGFGSLAPDAFSGASGFLKGVDFFANGGNPPVNRPSIVGERGPELFVPRTSGTVVSNDALEALSRYRPENSAQRSNQTVNVNYNVTEVNGMRYVTEEQFRAGLDQAAKTGAKMGQSMTISTLKNSRSQRSKIGL